MFNLPSQDDVLMNEMERSEKNAEKWAAVCRDEGHRYDAVGVCQICGKEIPEAECDCAGDELASGAHFSNCAFLRAKFNY